MAHHLFLDQLPVELVHALFGYFVAHEIFVTFSDLSSYINSILYSYSAYRLDFKSIRKDHFDLVCRRIRPEQVISLTLSDDQDTPGQSEIFFSHFQIKQFTQLRHLTLIMIEFKSLESIRSKLYKLNQLCSLSLGAAIIRCQGENQTYDINLLSYKNYTQVLSRLRRLDLNRDIVMPLLPLRQFYFLKFEIDSSEELERIFQCSSQLKSLSIRLNMDHWSRLDLIVPPNQLTELSLEIESK